MTIDPLGLDQLSVLNELVERVVSKSGETCVIYLDHSGLDTAELVHLFAHGVALLKKADMSVVIVHGFNDTADEQMLDGSNEVTHVERLRFVEMAAFFRNSSLVNYIQVMGASAIGLTGRDGRLVSARGGLAVKSTQYSNVKVIKASNVFGEIAGVNAELVSALNEADLVSVISPIAQLEGGPITTLSPPALALALAKATDADHLIWHIDCGAWIDQVGRLGTTISCQEGLRRVQSVRAASSDESLTTDLHLAISDARSRSTSFTILDGARPNALALGFLASANLGITINE